MNTYLKGLGMLKQYGGKCCLPCLTIIHLTEEDVIWVNMGLFPHDV